jgi:hypothetical protein
MIVFMMPAAGTSTGDPRVCNSLTAYAMHAVLLLLAPVSGRQSQSFDRPSYSRCLFRCFVPFTAAAATVTVIQHLLRTCCYWNEMITTTTTLFVVVDRQ